MRVEMKCLIFCSFAVAILAVCVEGSCQADPRTYSTSQTLLAEETVLIVHFSLSCSDEKDSVWYAQLGSDILPVVHMPETSHYQVTLSGSHDKFPAGKYTFNFFGESVIGEVRKALRDSEEVHVKPAFTVELQHSGASPPFWLATQFIASVGALLLWWLAYTAKAKLQA